MKSKIFFPTALLSMLLILACNSNQGDLPSELRKKLPEEYRANIDNAIQKAGDNKDEILRFLESTDKKVINSAAFIITNMPLRDLQTLSAEFLTENLKYSRLAVEKSNWAEKISPELFNNYILPYANINERRDQWRKDFHDRFYDLVKEAKSPGEAAVILNNKIWDIFDVHYNTKRPKADQSPYESIDASMASCTGLSILLVDACRSVGVPARFVGIPQWPHVRGNHSWVEVWDNDWHFLGAGEPGPLNETWFAERAKNALPDDPKHSIYAVSYARTAMKFPIIFRPGVDYVFADNVTENYLAENENMGTILSVRVFDREERVAVAVELVHNDKVIAKGISPGENRDLNDRLDFNVEKGKKYFVKFRYKDDDYKKSVFIDRGPKQNLDINL